MLLVTRGLILTWGQGKGLFSVLMGNGKGGPVRWEQYMALFGLGAMDQQRACDMRV